MEAKIEVYEDDGNVLKTYRVKAWFTFNDEEIDLCVALSDVLLDGKNGAQLTISPKALLDEMKKAFEK